jgi:Rrf2 family iron-sulfur cluster assembly transcriptional regulator
MKITAQEEYGLRILIRIARCQNETGMSIPQLSEAEGLSTHYIAKLTRILRMAGFINSTPGYKGGYILAQPAALIRVNEVLKTLGGELYSPGYCRTHAGALKLCTNSVDCSVRSLWQMIQFTTDQLLDRLSLQDLVGSESESGNRLQEIIQESASSYLATH